METTTFSKGDRILRYTGGGCPPHVVEGQIYTFLSYCDRHPVFLHIEESGKAHKYDASAFKLIIPKTPIYDIF